MSIEDRDYMRTVPSGATKKRVNSSGRVPARGDSRPHNGNVFSRSEQFGVLLAGAVVVALLLAAIL